MAVTKQSRQQSNSDIGNPELPMSSPTFSHNSDHSFTLQAVMEMQKSMGALETSVNNLATQISSQKQSMDDLKTKVGTIEKNMYAAWVILAIAIVAGGWMLNTAKDFAMMYYKTSIETHPKLPSTAPTANH